MNTHPKTVRLLTEWLSSTDELHTEVADFNALYQPGMLGDEALMRDFPMLHVQRLVLSHASSSDVLHVAQERQTGAFLAVVVGRQDQGKSIAESGMMQAEQRYRR